MAFTLHWANSPLQYTSHPNPRTLAALYDPNYIHNQYREKIGALAPALSLQHDVLFPNALQGVTNLLQGVNIAAVGCKGNQLDNAFPLEPRVQVPLPMVQYARNTQGPREEEDICALPVLNWEHFVKNMRSSCLPRPNTGKVLLPSGGGVGVSKQKERTTDTAMEEGDRQDGLLRPTKKYPLKTKYLKKSEVKKILLDTESDVEEAEKEYSESVETRRGPGRPRKPKHKITIKQQPLMSKKMADECVQRFTHQPDLKLRATWNYLYGGTGTSDWSYAERNERNLYVANGEYLRMISLKPSRENAMLSYTVASVWEENELPVFPQRKVERMEVLNNVIFQVQTQKRRNLVVVRRGRSVSIYCDERLPSLLCTVPNICFGATEYLGWKSKKPLKPSPLLVSLDLNHICSTELVTIDENAIIQFVDLSAQKVSHQAEAHRVQKTQASREPDFELNAASGVAYVGDHPSVIYQWVESQVSIYDRRDRPRNALTTELLNLRSSVASMSWSDQHRIRADSANMLSEYVSCLKPGNSALNYYVGTTSRVLLMDVRVPSNPVVKFEHGLRSPVACLDILSDDNFELLVGGSQRTCEFFCATFDNTHLACVDRPDCQQRNPVLQSYPRHLLSPRQFLNYSSERGYGFNFEIEQRKVEQHFLAWCTGLCVMNPIRTRNYNASLPHPFLLYTTNSFGDVFCQEWDQKPIATSRRVEENDPRLSSFMGNWKASMESSILDEFRRPSGNPMEPVDCSLIVESSTHSLKHCRRLRTRPFDAFTPSQLQYNRVCDSLPSVQEQIAAKVAQYDTPRVRSFLDVWTDQPRSVGSPDPGPHPGNSTQSALQQNNYGTDQATEGAGLGSDLTFQTGNENQQLISNVGTGHPTADLHDVVKQEQELLHEPVYSDMDWSEDELQPRLQERRAADDY